MIQVASLLDPPRLESSKNQNNKLDWTNLD